MIKMHNPEQLHFLFLTFYIWIKLIYVLMIIYLLNNSLLF